MQKDISESLSARPRLANEDYFTGKVLKTDDRATSQVTPQMAKQIYKYLLKNDYTDDDDRITAAYHEAKKAGHAWPRCRRAAAARRAGLPADRQRVQRRAAAGDRRRPQAQEESAQRQLRQEGVQGALEPHQPQGRLQRRTSTRPSWSASASRTTGQGTARDAAAVHHPAGRAGDTTTLRRPEGRARLSCSRTPRPNRTAALGSFRGQVRPDRQAGRRHAAHAANGGDILKGLNVAVFGQFKTNPEDFIAEAARLINEQKATVIVEHLAYDPVEERYELDIFTAGQTKQDFSKAAPSWTGTSTTTCSPTRTSSASSSSELDTSVEVVVYAKLPRGFLIPTPVGDYNPDWAIAFKEGAVKHVYFVAETKGSMSSMELRKIEETKIECARKFFDS